jgi:hypothetical protein
MRKTAIAGCVLIGLFSLFLAPAASFAAEQQATGGKEALIERGLYLVTMGDATTVTPLKK